MTRAIAWLQPGPVDTRTGGFIYNRRIMEALGEPVTVVELASSFPNPSTSQQTEAAARLAELEDGTTTVMDGLAFGALADEAAHEADRLHLVALVHHPLALETGLSNERRKILFESEKRALSSARRVIVTSPATAADLTDYQVPSEIIDIVKPGTDPAPLAKRTGGPPYRLLTVATITPRKGHAVLVKALARMTDLDWTLDCYGSVDRDAACAASVQALIVQTDLEHRINLHSECDQSVLEAAYAGADLLVLPSFHEGYGMAIAEALARGLPIVSTTAGAIPDTVPTDAGLLVPAGDVTALAAALRDAITDPALRGRLAAAAADARKVLPTWQHQANHFASILKRIN